MNPYSVIVQAGPSEILEVEEPSCLILNDIVAHPGIDKLLVALPDLYGAEAAAEKLKSWGFNAFVGDSYNVARRILEATKDDGFDFTVRFLCFWRNSDLNFVDRLVESMVQDPCDLVSPPKDFDLTLAADVASKNALEKIANFEGNSQEANRGRFNPWGYIEMNQSDFEVRHLEPAPSYNKKQVSDILAAKRNHSENEFFGRDYVGSRYHMITENLTPSGNVLDIACGSGFGTKLLSETADLVIGVDYMEEYIDKARSRYSENNKMKFSQGDGLTYLPNEGEGFFDLVISLHTLEHVPDDIAMLKNLYRNIKPGGRLIAEVPVQARRPLGVPINPWHIREYDLDDFIRRVSSVGFEIENVWGSSRSFYGDKCSARDAVQVWGKVN